MKIAKVSMPITALTLSIVAYFVQGRGSEEEPAAKYSVVSRGTTPVDENRHLKQEAAVVPSSLSMILGDGNADDLTGLSLYGSMSHLKFEEVESEVEKTAKAAIDSKSAKNVKSAKSSKAFRYLTTIPFDGSVAEPAKNTFYLCEGRGPTNMNGGPFAPWVDQATYLIDTANITFVEGSVPVEGEFCVETSSNQRRLVGNGLPKGHNIGSFPIQPTNAAYSYYEGRPCPIGCFPSTSEIDVNPYTVDITIPKNPVYNEEPSCISILTTGIATATGVAFHAEYAFLDESMKPNNPIAVLPTDSCFGHPVNNAYHYHAKTWECFPNQGKANEHSPLFGYALDGFGIFGPRSLKGKLVTNEDLDECHGHTHVIDWDGKKIEMFHYHLNTEFPYSIGCFRGTPVAMIETLQTTCLLEEIKVVSEESMTEVPIKKVCL